MVKVWTKIYWQFYLRGITLKWVNFLNKMLSIVKKKTIQKQALLNFNLFRNPWVLSIMPNIPEIVVGIQMERSVSVSSDRNIRDHFWRWSTYFGRNIPTKIYRYIFHNRFFASIREFGKGIKSGKCHSYWLARFNRKMSFHFPRVFPLISDRSVWHNGKHP